MQASSRRWNSASSTANTSPRPARHRMRSASSSSAARSACQRPHQRPHQPALHRPAHGQQVEQRPMVKGQALREDPRRPRHVEPPHEPARPRPGLQHPHRVQRPQRLAHDQPAVPQAAASSASLGSRSPGWSPCSTRCSAGSRSAGRRAPGWPAQRSSYLLNRFRGIVVDRPERRPTHPGRGAGPGRRPPRRGAGAAGRGRVSPRRRAAPVSGCVRRSPGPRSAGGASSARPAAARRASPRSAGAPAPASDQGGVHLERGQRRQQGGGVRTPIP